MRSIESQPNDKDQTAITFKPIGIIRTEFPEKRAVPRQPAVCSKLTGYIELNKDVFNNPEHSLDRLSDFSHLWIIYHFHKNDTHAKAKVAPPRLGGERVGIFSTRSPHRPCPIGLSLVEIDRIDVCRIYFRGTDMIDGTPILDIKPYIPRYDSPIRNRLTGIYIYMLQHFECELRLCRIEWTFSLIQLTKFDLVYFQHFFFRCFLMMSFLFCLFALFRFESVSINGGRKPSIRCSRRAGR